MVLSGCLILAGIILSCNRETVGTSSPESPVIFPPPPDTTRIQYLTRFSTSEDLHKKQGKLHRYLFGEEEPLGIIKPYGVTVRGSKVYICDTGLAGLVILDLEEGSFECFIPGGKGQLQLPINCCFDARDNLLIADANRRQVVVFDKDKNYVAAFGEAEDFKPTDVEYHGGKIWVSNVQGHSVLGYHADTRELTDRIPGLEPGEEGFIRQSTNIAWHKDILYVSDFGDFNVKQYSQNGEFLGVFGGYGNSPGRFTRPKGIALDLDDNLYVVDAAFENTQIFNRGRALLMYFGGPYEGPGAMWLPAAVEISHENLSYFQPYVDESFELKYLVYVTNQYGPSKVNVYGFVQEKQRFP
jgi:hypothetical protein